jgi:anti-sigma B factor antagonist
VAAQPKTGTLNMPTEDTSGQAPRPQGDREVTIVAERDPAETLPVRLKVSGELDLASAPRVKEAVSVELTDGRDVILDLSEVSFIDSTGLAAVISAANRARELARSLRIAPKIQAQPRRLMELTQVFSALSIAEE